MNINNEMNALDMASLVLAILNLSENRQQSQYNDVHKANDEQAELLLKEINKRFAEQNEMIDCIHKIQQNHTDMLKEILDRLGG